MIAVGERALPGWASTPPTCGQDSWSSMLTDRLLVQIPNIKGERSTRAGILIPASRPGSKRLAWPRW